MDDQDLTNNRGLASICGVGRNLLMKYLREGGVLTKYNTPMTKVKDAGYAVVRFDSRDEPITWWTTSGVQWMKAVVARAEGLGQLKPKPLISDHEGDQLEKNLRS